MSAVVCGKRSSSIFDEFLHTPPPASKRVRCSAGVSSSPTASPRLSPPPTNSGDGNLFAAHLAHLRSHFPEMDQRLLERVLEASANDLDSAIKSLNDVHLESTEFNLGSAVGEAEDEIGNNNGDFNAAATNPPASDGLPGDGSEWVELFVREMMNASDMDDARARASRVLGVLEKSIVARAGTEALQNFHKENMKLKEQVDLLLRENTVLKRAVAIQHEHQKEYDEKSQELEHLKQIVSQYQEQLRTLEVSNYALAMHLRQAQQSNSIPGRFHPDVF